MILKREDLLAAASAGILQYKQVDTMLVFLRHREAVNARETQPEDGRQPGHGRPALLSLLAILGVAAAMVLAAINLGYLPHNLQFAGKDVNAVSLQWFIGFYAVFTLMVAIWTVRSRVNGAVRVLVTTLIALVPLALVASQHYRFL